MRILFLSRWFPFPPNNGSKLRIYNLIRGLSKQHDLALLSFADQPADEAEMRKFCSEVRVVSWKEFDPNRLKARLGFFRLEPRSIVDTYSAEMAEAISQALGAEKYDLIIASQLQMAAYAARFGRVPAIFEEIELGIFHDRANLPSGTKSRLRHSFTWLKLRLYLARLLNQFNACTVASEQEGLLLHKSFPNFQKPVVTIPNCVDLDEYRNVTTKKQNNTLIFTGSFRFHANYEAMLWFVGQVFPLILQRFPETQLIVTGDHQNLPLPSQKNITLTGYVDDPKTLLASAAVSIAPLLTGGGTRLKILEAMALGTPVVATSKGAEGLDVQSGVHLLLADSPTDFAEQILRILSAADERRRLAENAFELVKERYSLETVTAQYAKLIETITQQNQAAPTQQ